MEALGSILADPPAGLVRNCNVGYKCWGPAHRALVEWYVGQYGAIRYLLAGHHQRLR